MNFLIETTKRASRMNREASCFFMERAMGIEPTSRAWEARILPMNYARINRLVYHIMFWDCWQGRIVQEFDSTL